MGHWSDNARELAALRRYRQGHLTVYTAWIHINEAMVWLKDSMRQAEINPENYQAKRLRNIIIEYAKAHPIVTDRALFPATVDDAVPPIHIIRKAQHIINAEFKKRNMLCVARYDDISEKFVVFPENRASTFWHGRSGIRRATRACKEMY